MTVRPSILVVDDEPQILRFLEPSLVVSGFEVITAMSGREALHAIRTRTPDLVIVDLGLPDMDGKDVITEIRRSLDVPILVLSARDREAEKIAALDLGADDYVNKPFAIGELLARLRSISRRHRTGEIAQPERLLLGPIAIDTAAHTVQRDGESIRLTPKEFELLVLLARYPGRVLTHRQILTKVWGPAHGTDTPYLRVFIGQLRQKLEADPTDPRLILTEPGIGYRAAAD